MTKVKYERYGSTQAEIFYKYDALGRRVARKLDSALWRWYLDGLKVIAEGTGTNDKVFYANAPGAVGGIILAFRFLGRAEVDDMDFLATCSARTALETPR